MARPRAKSSAARAAARPAATPKRRTSGARASTKTAAGRPAKYSARVHKAIVDVVREGLPKTFAFRAAAIHEDTGFAWLRAGREQPDEHPEYARLAADLLRAEAEYALEMVRIVRAEARRRKPGSWLPAMTSLERRFPEHFGRRDTTVLEGGESPLRIDGKVLIGDDGLRELAGALLRRAAALSSQQPGGPGVGSEPPAE